ncbi:DUF5979 domain-containing protein, partial [Actinobaculum sp. 352]|uniref:DUF5979 domain-containing protein n=1 Tax=Actinobaculum sp. 352 TaxID=2490946 RepID=UPI000F7D6D7B
MTGHTRVAAPDGRRYRRLVLAFTALVAMLCTQIGIVAPAQAADNPNIKVSDLVLTKTDSNGNPQGGGLRVEDYARLDFSWDASSADVKDGDSFTIDLGSYFRNLEYPKSTPMTVTYNGQQVEIGTCDLTRTTVVCTFNEKAEELKNSGFTAISGTGSAMLRVLVATDSETADITTNGVTSVDLPDTGGIGEVIGTPFSKFRFDKWAGGLLSDGSKMQWGLNFGTEYLTQQAGLPLDGSRQTITITDTLGEGLYFDPATFREWILYYRGTEGQDSVITLNALTDATGNDRSLTWGDFDMDVEIDATGRVATIKVTGPFLPNSNYSVVYWCNFEGGEVTRGVVYDNEATITGTEVQGESSRTFVESFSITVNMKAGYGGFDITKLATGAGAATVPANTEFTVDVEYELPAAASNYADWEAPGTLNADGLTGTTTMTVILGQKVPFNGTFPQGTKITLSEDPNSENASGLSWGTPVFTIGSSTTNTLTISDQISTAVTLTNTTAPQGTFAVKKTVTGSAEAVSKEFSFDYSCSDGSTGSLKVKGDGNAVKSDKNFALGTTCTITEDASSAQLAEYSLDVPEAQTVEISDATSPVEVAFTNDYKRLSGGFSVKKTVAGDAADLAPASFDFEYACIDAAGKETASGTLTVQNGESASAEDIPTGTCTVSEKSAGVDGAQLATKLTVDGEAVDGNTATVNVTDGSAVVVEATNTYTRERGSFSVKKAVTGEYTPVEGDSFTVKYTCDDADKTEGTLNVPADGTAVTVDGLPAGTSCTVAEDEASAQRDGYALDVSYSSDKVMIEKCKTQEVTVTNEYTRLVGGFTVAKTVDGDGAQLAPASFDFDYSCADAAGVATVSGTLTVQAGSSASVADVPTGSCTVKEKDASVANTQLTTKLTVDGAAVDGDTATVNVTDGASVAVEATNTYTRDRGSFSVAKKVTGDYTSGTGESFKVNYTCDDADKTSGSLSVPADGTAVMVDGLPVGTTCTLTEDAESSQREGYALATSYSSTTVMIEKDKTLPMTVTNEYTRLVGGFTVAKTVDGDGAQFAPQSFGFDYTCVDGAGNETMSGT